jgi:hypothetical protein
VSDSHYSYQVQPTTGDNTESQTPAQREAQSASLRQPGRAIFDGNGYRVEQIQSTPQPPSAQERSRDWLNSLTGPANEPVDLFNTKLRESQIMVPLPDGDVIDLASAKKANLIRRNAKGELVAAWDQSRPTEPQPAQGERIEEQSSTPQQQETPAEDLVAPLAGDQTLGEIASAIGDAPVYSLIEATALGQGLSAHRAQSIAQATGNEPEAVAAMYDALVTEYGEVGSKALIAAGVPEDRIAEAVEWARSHKKGDLIDAFGDMIRQSSRSTSKLKAIGREYMKATAGGYSDAQLAEMALPEGASWSRGDQGQLLITIKGYGTVGAQQALRSGVLRF